MGITRSRPTDKNSAGRYAETHAELSELWSPNQVIKNLHKSVSEVYLSTHYHPRNIHTVMKLVSIDFSRKCLSPIL